MKKKYGLKIFIFTFLAITVIYPIFMMLLNIDLSNFSNLISSPSFKEALGNSIYITLISTFVSLVIAYLLAYALNRTNIKRRAVLKLFITIPMLIPSISHGLGLINLFGTNGLISRNYGFNIIGPIGIIIGSVMYSFPIAFLMFDDGFKYVDNNLYDSAKILGFNKWQTFWKVTFCYMKKPIFSALFAVFTMIFTDYGVPLSVGGKFITLPVFLYKEVIGLLDYSKGTMIGLFLLIPAFISFLFDILNKDYSNGDFEGNEDRVTKNSFRDVLFKIYTYLVVGFILAIIGSFIFYAFIDNIVLNPTFSIKHFEYILNDNIVKFAINSIFISTITAIFGTIITYFCAYATARVKGISGKIIHIFVISTLAIPGLVLGLAYAVSFNGTFIYNTFAILIIINIIHFISSPYLMAYNALLKINMNYEIVAKTCNISMFKVIKDVILPCTKSTVREMFAYFFVNAMITISAITFLFNTRTMPLSLLINNYEGNMMLGEAAIISLFILFVNMLLKGIIYLINRKEDRRKYYEYNNESV